VPRGTQQACPMQRPMGHFTALQAHRLEDLKRTRRPFEESSLHTPLARLAACPRIGGDGAADATARPPLHDLDGADGNIERRVPSRTNHPHRAAIYASRSALQAANPMHRPDLGRTGHRSAGKKCLEDFTQTHRFAQLRLDVRAHLPHRRPGLRMEEPRHTHAAGSGQTREIVADEIDDHHVFRPLLFIRTQT